MRAAERRAGQARQALAQAEHGSRAHEAAAQKLSERLAARVRAEERRLQRDADAHSRIKAALTSHKGQSLSQSLSQSVSQPVDYIFSSHLGLIICLTLIMRVSTKHITSEHAQRNLETCPGSSCQVNCTM